MRDEFPALTTWQQIGFILATPDYNDGEPYLDEGDMNEVAVLLDTYKAERDAERDDLRGEMALLRAIAQAALDNGGDRELVYAPLYQQALEDIADSAEA